LKGKKKATTKNKTTRKKARKGEKTKIQKGKKLEDSNRAKNI